MRERILPSPISFRRADLADERLVARWFNAPHVSEFWGQPEVNIGDFHAAMAGTATLFNYWIGEDGDMSFCMLATSNAAMDTPTHLAPFLSSTGDTWTLDVLIGPIEYIGRGIAADMLVSFMDFLREMNPNLAAILIDPEADNPRAIHVYSKAGFRQVSAFTPTEGPFQGKSHVLMACHYD